MKHSVFGVAILVFLWAMYSLFRIGTTLAPDFSVFFDAARGLLGNENIYELPMYTGLGYPPFTLLPFLPFTMLPFMTSQGIFLAISLLSLFVCMVISLKLLFKKWTLLHLSLVFIFAFLAFPTKFTFGMGQVNLMALALLLAAVWNITIKRSGVAGIVLGLAFVIKPHLLFFLPVFLLAGHWKTVVLSLATLTLAVVTTGITFGWDHYAYYFQTTLPPLLVFSGRDIYYNQGLASILSRTLPRGLAADLTVWGSMLLVIGAIWFVWKKRLPLMESLLLSIPVFLLVEPLSWQHHYVFLLPVYLWLVIKAKQNSRKILLIALSYLLVSVNIRAPAAFETFSLGWLILSHVFWGNLLALALVVHETA